MVKTFIRKGVLTICLNLFILFLGVFTLPHLSNEFIPAVEVPAVAVIVPTTLMAEEEVKSKVVIPLEKAFSKSGKVKNTEVEISPGKAIFVLYYYWTYTPEESLRFARQVVRNMELPKDTLRPIFILHRPSNSPILRVAYYGDEISEIGKLVGSVATEIERIPGVSQVRKEGEVPKKLTLEIDSRKLAEFGLNSSDIVLSAKKNWNLRRFIKGEQLNHYLSFPLERQADLERLLVYSSHHDRGIPVNWIGQIYNKTKHPPVVYGQNRPAIILEVLKSPGADTLKIVNLALKKIDAKNSKSVKHKVIYNEAKEIEGSQDGLFQNFIIGVVLNSIILMIFLGSPIGVFVASVVFPTAVLGTVFAMKWLGISFNLFSLNGFSLAVGMITDASTVVLESIVKRVQRKEDLFDACWKGAGDVGLGVLASTLTTAGVLLPIAMQKNVSSKLFADLSLTVVFTQLVCLIAVFTLVPWLCFKMFKSQNEKKSGIIQLLFTASSKFVQLLVSFSGSIQTKAKVNARFRIAFPSTVVVLSLGTLMFLPQSEFLPTVSSKVYSVNYPLSATQRQTESMKIREAMTKNLSKQSQVNWSIGKIANDSVEILFETKGALTVNKIRDFFEDPLIDDKRLNIIPLGPAPSEEKMGFSGLYYITPVKKHGPAGNVIDEICKLDQMDYCWTQDKYLQGQYNMRPKHVAAMRMGQTSIDLNTQILLPLNELNLRDVGNLDIKRPFYLSVPFKKTLLDSSMEINKGWHARVGDLFTSNVGLFKETIHRNNGLDYTPLFIRIKNATIGEINNLVNEVKEKFKLNRLQFVEKGGLERMNETFTDMTKALILSTLIVFTILVLQFKSVAQTLVIMGSIPLTLGGAILGLIIMGETLNASVLVGFILLIGIVVNNGIFLVEATNQKLVEGLAIHEAVRGAVSERTRPILMTSCSTIFGMLPTIVIAGDGSELYRGMAIVNIFGMVIGTFLSLVVTPLFIEYFSQTKNNKTKSVEVPL